MKCVPGYDRAYSALWRKERPIAVQAHRAVRVEIAAGRLPPAHKAGPCVDCGRAAECYDHRDYAKPLEIVAVCLSCNKKRGAAHPYIGAAAVDVGVVR